MALQRGRAPESAEWVGITAAKDFRMLPSTGPRSGERGVWTLGSAFARTAEPFNGAALRRARSATGNVGDSPRGPAFNGAALRRARSEYQINPCTTAGVHLQRGRAPESAEWNHFC